MIENPLLGSNLSLRAPEPEDLETLYEWENNSEIWNVSDTIVPISRFLLKQYLENARKDIYETRQLRLIIQLNDSRKPVGAIDLFDFDPYHKRAGIGILIAGKADRRKGYASEALNLVINYAFEVLQLHQLYCSISRENHASIELFRKSGFEITGTRLGWTWNGETYSDEHFLQIIR